MLGAAGKRVLVRIVLTVIRGGKRHLIHITRTYRRC
jgi:hypothetical protein